MTTIWRALEDLGGRGAVPLVWQSLTGAEFDALWFLQPTGRTAATYPCPHGCGCGHEVVRRGDGTMIGVCTCEDLGGCEDVALGPEQVQVHELNVPRLGRAVTRALDCDPRSAKTGVEFTWQIGAYSASALPLLLTLASGPGEFRAAVAELSARLRSRFILFAPTNRFFDARCRELLANWKAGFFDLESHFRSTGHGALHALRPPGELLQAFAPETVTGDEDTARRAFALIQQLESSSPPQPPGVLTVFRWYCVEELTAAQVARKCRCSKTTVIDRLKLIRKATGVPAQQLRRLSAHLGTIEAAATDSRASHIHRKTLIDDAEEED